MAAMIVEQRQRREASRRSLPKTDRCGRERGNDIDENTRRVTVMQTIEEVRGQMGMLHHILDDIETVLAAKQAGDETHMPIAPEQIGVLIRELELLRLRIERLTPTRDVVEAPNW